MDTLAWFTLGAQISTTFAVLGAGGIFWLRNFKIQKRVEAQALAARNALNEVLEVKIALIRLVYGKTEEEREVAFFEYMPVHLIKLQYALFLLRSAPKIKASLQEIEGIIKIIFDHRVNPNVEASAGVIRKFLSKRPLDGIEESTLLNDLTHTLLNIHELNDLAKDN